MTTVEQTRDPANLTTPDGWRATPNPDDITPSATYEITRFEPTDITTNTEDIYIHAVTFNAARHHRTLDQLILLGPTTPDSDDASDDNDSTYEPLVCLTDVPLHKAQALINSWAADYETDPDDFITTMTQSPQPQYAAD